MSCTGDINYTKSMILAERMMEDNPDSSLMLLREDSTNVLLRNKATCMYYTLLKTLAEYKCYIPHTSDSVMLEVSDYYRFHGTPHQKLLSWYVLGSVYSDMNMSADAIRCFKRSLDVGRIGDNDVYVARSSNQIGHILMYQGMYSQSLPYFLDSYREAKTAHSISVMIFSLRDIARSYASRKMFRQACIYFSKAVSLVKLYPQYSDMLNMIYSEFSLLYLDMGCYQKAKSLFLLQKLGTRQNMHGSYYCSGGRIYLANGQLDAATFYYEKCLGSDNLYSKIEATSALIDIYHGKDDDEKCYFYAKKNQYWTDSLQKITVTGNSNLIRSLNDKLKTEKENSELRMQLLLVFVFVLVLMAIILLYIRHKRKIWRYKERLYKEAQQKMEINSNQYKEKSEARIKKLIAQINEAKNSNNEDREQTLSLYKRKEENKLKQISLLDEQQKLLIEEFRKTALFDYFMTKAGGTVDIHNKIPDAKWEELMHFLNLNFNSFADRMTEIYGIDGRNLHLCCLIKLCFSNKEISNIFCLSKSAIPNMRKRLFDKMFNRSDGTAIDLDNFLRHL